VVLHRTRSPSGAFIGAVIGALVGGINPPASMMLTGFGVITFIISGAIIGTLIGSLAHAIMKRSSDAPKGQDR
jgi:hypothetical protein